MTSSPVLSITFLISLFTLSSVLSLNLQTYIIHVHPSNSNLIDKDEDLESYYRSFLPQTIRCGYSQDSDRLVYSYSDAFTGFAARLTEEELQETAQKQGFVHAYPNTIIPLLTTHTPDFLGLTGRMGLWNRSNLGKGVIVGVLDTGILPGHPSFNDDGMSSPPSRWKGNCEFDEGCSNKIIGAVKFFFTSSETGGNTTSKSGPTDDVGHGTHTASTIAGNFVNNANLFGLANGTSAGMAPHAHLAIYRVCNSDGCPSADILAGLDRAIKDGVDILSLSLGAASMPYDQDPIAIGSFRAFQKGITVVCAAGNSGPYSETLSNEAPWVLTVAASTIDRSLRATVKLGNGKELYGEALYQPNNFSSDPISLVYPSVCSADRKNAFKGKIVVCANAGAETANYVLSEGGVGVILVNEESRGYVIAVRNYPLASSSLSFSDAADIRNYTRYTRKPTSSIVYDGTVLGTTPAPVIAHFSSRGPNQQSPGILKPDISAPGVNIFAAWNKLVDENSKTPFNIISGTSMATPHVSGIAALLRSMHPDWSPSAIKSAIITSSDILGRDGQRILDEQHKSASFFASGAGHVNPLKAANPGLVYEVEADDYIAYLCGSLGKKRMSTIVLGNYSCDKPMKDVELNYPTIVVPLTSETIRVNRTVTNVGNANAKYIVDVSDTPKELTVTVEPKTLQFSKVNEKQSFTVSFTWRNLGIGGQANLKWVSGDTVVRSSVIFLLHHSE